MPSLEEYAEMLENLKQNLEGVDNMTKKNTQEKAVQEENVKVEEVKKTGKLEAKMVIISMKELEEMLDHLEYRIYKGLARKLNKITRELKEAFKEKE
jgi:hypothetical protein